MIVLDAESVVLRYHFAGREVAPSVRALCRRVDDRSPVVACFGSPGPTWRHEMWPRYKAHRPPTSNAVHEALRDAEASMASDDVRIARVAGYEADDVVAGEVVRAGRCVVVSDDKDMAQLVDDLHGVTLYVPRLGVAYAEADVFQAFGCTPRQIPDYLALMGDASDGIPGVPGIGPKAARWILEAFGSLEAALDRLKAGGVVAERRIDRLLREHEEAARLYLRLARLRVPEGYLMVG